MTPDAQELSGAIRKIYFCLSPVMVSFQVSAKTTGTPRSLATSFPATPTELWYPPPIATTPSWVISLSIIALAFSGSPSVSAMTTSMSQSSTPPAALMSRSASSIATRMASPPVTEPGADNGANPPILIGQLTAIACELMAIKPKKLRAKPNMVFFIMHSSIWCN